MRIGILTNLDNWCGIAEYGRDLENYIREQGVDVFRAENPEALLKAEAEIGKVDVVMVNYHPVTMPLLVVQVRALQGNGKKVILIEQNSWHESFIACDDSMFKAVDAVVAHEEMTGNVKVHYIPLGIPVVDGLPVLASEKRIGVAGFSFSQKRMDMAAKIAKDNGVILRMIAPYHTAANTQTVVDQVRNIMPPGRLELIREYLPTEEVVRLLAECTMTMFWYESQIPGDSFGQSASARLGLAARRPIVIPRQRKFWTMCRYDDEIYVANSEYQAAIMAKDILDAPEKAHIPDRIFMETNWREAAKKYINLAQELMA